QCTASGRVSAATSATQSFSACRRLPAVPGGSSKSLVRAFTVLPPASNKTETRGRRAGARSAGDEGGHHVADVGFELVVLQARVLQLQVELEEADVGRVGQARAVLGVAAAEPGLA